MTAEPEYAVVPVDEAASALLRGRAVVFPTDTIYGVGVCVTAVKSPDILYELKGRSRDKPIAWLVSSIDDLARYGRDVSSYAMALAQAFWPGGLTLVVRASPEVPEAFRSDEGTIGLRMPKNDVARALLQAVATPLATTSANFAEESAARTLDDLDSDFVKRVGCVVSDRIPVGKETVASGIASTILDCTGVRPCPVREGGITMSDINVVCGSM